MSFCLVKTQELYMFVIFFFTHVLFKSLTLEFKIVHLKKKFVCTNFLDQFKNIYHNILTFLVSVFYFHKQNAYYYIINSKTYNCWNESVF